MTVVPRWICEKKRPSKGSEKMAKFTLECTLSDMLLALSPSAFVAMFFVWTIESHSVYFHALFSLMAARLYTRFGPRLILRIS